MFMEAESFQVEVFRLILKAPLYFFPMEGLDPFDRGAGEGGEKLFCFDLDEGHSVRFEPDNSFFFKNMIFSGKAAGDRSEDKARDQVEPVPHSGAALFEIPSGSYIFSQAREALQKEGIAAMALEIQQEALWQRLIPGKLLYLRYLFEDGRDVTQLFRPYFE